jgi:hypothetical protein
MNRQANLKRRRQTKTKMAPRSTRTKTAKVVKIMPALDWSRNKRFPAAVSRPIPVARVGRLDQRFQNIERTAPSTR